jgi:hypothetical protein
MYPRLDSQTWVHGALSPSTLRDSDTWWRPRRERSSGSPARLLQNSKGEVVRKGDLKAQLNQAWENVRLALADSGATFHDVMKVTTYVVNLQALNARRSPRSTSTWATPNLPPPL